MIEYVATSSRRYEVYRNSVRIGTIVAVVGTSATCPRVAAVGDDYSVWRFYPIEKPTDAFHCLSDCKDYVEKVFK